MGWINTTVPSAEPGPDLPAVAWVEDETPKGRVRQKIRTVVVIAEESPGMWVARSPELGVIAEGGKLAKVKADSKKTMKDHGIEDPT